MGPPRRAAGWQRYAVGDPCVRVLGIVRVSAASCLRSSSFRRGHFAGSAAPSGAARGPNVALSCGYAVAEWR